MASIVVTRSGGEKPKRQSNTIGAAYRQLGVSELKDVECAIMSMCRTRRSLVDALQRADKVFEMIVYPRARHGIFGKHDHRVTLDFMQRTLRPQP